MSYEQRIGDWIKDIKNISKITKNLPILPSPPDSRDYTEPVISSSLLPDKVKLETSPLVLNQGQTPFCGGASGAGMANGYYHNQDIMPDKGFSMTFIYWLSKKYDGIPEQKGTFPRTICKIMSKYGCAPEQHQPYSTENNPKINPIAFELAKRYKVNTYRRIMTIHEIKTALALGHYVLMATFVTGDNWSSNNGGWITRPSGSLYGGHATFLYGYDDNLINKLHGHKGYFLGQNSWGSNWGDYGKYYLPYDYFNFNLPQTGRSKFIEAWSLEFEPVKTINRKPKDINPWYTYRELHNEKRRLWR